MTTDSCRDFYTNLHTIHDFKEVSDPRLYTPVPMDWHVVITDVRGSTKAVTEGRYREVNTVGASSIAAVLKVAGKIDVPFVFGGDGATFLVPDELLADVLRALQGVIRLSEESFSLPLRVGAVPISHIADQGQFVSLARFVISSDYHQAMIYGGGIAYAERLIKDPDPANPYLVHAPSDVELPPLDGLRCRWEDVLSPHGETVSIIVKALSMDGDIAGLVYRETIEKIEEVYFGAEKHHPITVQNLKMATTDEVLSYEARAHQGLHSNLLIHLYVFRLRIFAWLERLAERLGFSFFDANLKHYKEHLVQTTDYKKFDDTLRMVISGNEFQRSVVEEYLANRLKAGELVYGVHVSDRALMTCLVFERYGKQVHFVDGADGGYTLAAKQLKSQIASRAEKDNVVQ